MNQDVSCANCVIPGRLPTGHVVSMSRPMIFVGQFPVRGIHTYAYHCIGCNGKAYLQNLQDPRTGTMGLVPVRLVGDEAEYQPNHVKPHEQVSIPVAYTLGSDGRADHHIPADPIQAPSPSIQLDPRIGSQTVITHEHPMHPDNVRRRIHPVSLDEFTGR